MEETMKISTEDIRIYAKALRLSNLRNNCGDIIHKAQIDKPSYMDFIMKGLYMKANGFRIFAPLTASEIQELDTFTAHFIPILTERTIPVQQKYLRRQRLSQINATTARALIQAAFKEKGLEAEVTGQIYRAKVSSCP